MSGPDKERRLPQADPGAGRIGVVAALDEELEALLARLEGTSRERRGGLVIHDGRLRGRPLALASTGDGHAAAAAGLAELVESRELVAVLAVGVAGGLSPALAVGDVVVGERVVEGGGGASELSAPAWPGRRPALAGLARIGTAVSVQEILCTAAEKEGLWRRLGAPEAAVVDLESLSWARLASDRGLPWMVLRSVSDAASEDLPLDFNRFRDSRGRMRRRAVALHAAVHPAVIPALGRLRGQLRECAGRLAAVAEAVVTA